MSDGYRSYEVYQRERVGETTNLLSPRELISAEMLTDPWRLLGILRENYPCYRDWVGNRFWITRYDDVTSTLRDDANYESRPRSWFAGWADAGRDLGPTLAFREMSTERIDRHLERVVDGVVGDLEPGDDLVAGFRRLHLELLAEVFDVPPHGIALLGDRISTMLDGTGWEPRARQAGEAAFRALGDDLGADAAATLLEADHHTLPHGLANLWFLLLTHPEQLDVVRADPRLVKFAWLEALRHSPPDLDAARFARHEVERFGRLLPTGALLHCSAAAANRDPRAFGGPDDFLVTRKDLCQREPRGQYRADGLPSGIALGLGTPSLHPAEPKERPRSLYARTRDVAVTMSRALLDAHPTIRLAADAEPRIRARRLGGPYSCWELPVTW